MNGHGLDRTEIDSFLEAGLFTGRAAEQVEEFLAGVLEPALEGIEEAAVEEPRV